MERAYFDITRPALQLELERIGFYTGGTALSTAFVIQLTQRSKIPIPLANIWATPEETSKSTFGQTKLYYKALKATDWIHYLPTKTTHNSSIKMKGYIMDVLNTMTGNGITNMHLDVCARVRSVRGRIEDLIKDTSIKQI